MKATKATVAVFRKSDEGAMIMRMFQISKGNDRGIDEAVESRA